MDRHAQNLHQRLKLIGVGLFAILVCVSSMGCARDGYRYGLKSSQRQPHVVEAQNPTAVGGDHPFVDRVEAVVQAPRRFARRVLGRRQNSDAEDAGFRREATELSQTYLLANGMDDVHIDVRRYEPGEQWRRIRNNDRIAPLWKYTGGTLAWLGYTLIPKRALRADRYDVFANTLSINSSRPTSALYQAARAKEFQQHRLLGTYAMLQRAPLVPLYHHSRATSDVLSYARDSGQSEETLKRLYPMAYSRLASAGVSEALFFSPLPADTPFVVEPAIRIVGGVIGGAMGRVAMLQELGRSEVSQADYEETDGRPQSLD